MLVEYSLEHIKNISKLDTSIGGNHLLNLELSISVFILAIRNFLGTADQATVFFVRNYPNSNLTLKAATYHMPQKIKGDDSSATRFIEKHRSTLTSVELFKSISIIIENIPKMHFFNCQSFLGSHEDQGFSYKSFACVSLRKPLSILFQEKFHDMISTFTHAKDIRIIIKKIHRKSFTRYLILHQNLGKMSSKLK